MSEPLKPSMTLSEFTSHITQMRHNILNNRKGVYIDHDLYPFLIDNLLQIAPLMYEAMIKHQDRTLGEKFIRLYNNCAPENLIAQRKHYRLINENEITRRRSLE